MRWIFGMVALFVLMASMPSPATALDGDLLLEILLGKRHPDKGRVDSDQSRGKETASRKSR